jgi:NADH-quinone oxidoreductase subunit L
VVAEIAPGILRYAWIIALLPFVAAPLIIAFGKRMPGKGAGIGIAAIGVGFVMSVAVLWHFVQGGSSYASGVNWFQIGPLHVEAGQFIDGLAAVMLVVVTAVSLCVQIYSLGYMHGDERFTWFYVVLSLFTGAMLNVVIAPNLIQLLIGWEIMGVCSYLLIGHWWEDRANSNAAIKAFLTTRVGDVPFMFGIFALIAMTGFTTSNITVISGVISTHQVPSAVVAAAAILLFGGTIGKSAQFPLHVWLPDAMAGPTPVSALIHAATMVAAGVYLVGRMYTVFINADPWVLHFVAIIAAITMLGAALLALVQDDIKRVLAYSTLSQLSYMVAALGTGPAGRNAAFFHLFTHAFFKALLFLGAGSVIHAVHSNNMSDMGGLKRHMPITFWTFMIGSVALAGIPPLAGFWSKDEILVSAHDGHMWLFIIMLITAALTAFYTMRMVWLTFFGKYQGHGHPHESPATMTGPLVALAVASVGVGFLGAAQFRAVFFKWVTFGEAEKVTFVPWIALVGALCALGGVALAFLMYRRKGEADAEAEAAAEAGEHAHARRDPLQPILGPLWNVFQNRYFIDAFYMRAIVFPVRDRLSAGVYWTNQHILDAVVNGAAMAARGIAKLVAWFDRNVIDGFVNATGESAGQAGGALKYIQSGNVQWYAVGLFVGVIALTIVFVKVA